MGKLHHTCLVIAFLSAPLALASGTKPPGGLDQPTPFQTECQQQALAKGPTTVVFGFDGLGAYDAETLRELREGPVPSRGAEPPRPSRGQLLWGMIAQGILQSDGDKEWHYFAENSVDGKKLSDPMRCAWEWSRARYASTKDGELRRNRIVLMGFSYGGHAAAQLAYQLTGLGFDVDQVITADPRTKGWVGKLEKVARIGHWANFYQKNTPFLNGYKVKGADFEQNLSRRGYGHTDVPRSDEVSAFVRGQVP